MFHPGSTLKTWVIIHGSSFLKKAIALLLFILKRDHVLFVFHTCFTSWYYVLNFYFPVFCQCFFRGSHNTFSFPLVALHFGFCFHLDPLPSVPEMLAVLCVEIQVPPSPNKDDQKTKMKLNGLSGSVLVVENWKTRYVMFLVCFIREPFTVKKSIYLARNALPGMHAVNAFCKAQNWYSLQ